LGDDLPKEFRIMVNECEEEAFYHFLMKSQYHFVKFEMKDVMKDEPKQRLKKR
jgi:hypothetical protein